MAFNVKSINADSVKAFLKKHMVCVICIGIMFLGMIVGGIVSSIGKSQLNGANKALTSINNQITQIENASKQTVVQIEKLDSGLNTERWHSDDKIAAQWLISMFSFNNADEYNACRKIAIDDLSAKNEFVLNYFPEYNSGFREQEGEGAVRDNSRIYTQIRSFRSYVVDIDSDTDTYSYIASIDYDSSLPKEYTGFLSYGNTMYVTYDLSKDGEISNFYAIQAA